MNLRPSSIFSFVFLCSYVDSFTPPQIISDYNIQSDDLIGDFIELKEGDDIRLSCEHPQTEQVDFVLPELKEFKFFDPADYATRQQIGGDDWSSTLVIKNAKVTDTGLYACVVRNEPSLAHHVYVFINGPKLFIPLEASGYSVDPYNYAVPCKTSRNVPKKSVILQVNGEEWKLASKKYDPRFGFNITEKVSEFKLTSQLPFKCTSTVSHESIDFFLSPRTTSDQKIEIEWGEISPWTHVGGELAVECVLKGNLRDEKYRHKLNITCPRCGSDAVSVQTRTKMRGMANSISISNVTIEDHGTYKCNWYFENMLQQTIEKVVNVSAKKGQIKIIETAPQFDKLITVKDKGSFTLNVTMLAYPLHLPGFTLKWMRHYIKPPKESPILETIITDATHLQESKIFENQITESLTVKDVRTNSSGSYVLSIEILDTVRTVEFLVGVVSEDIVPKIQITSTEFTALFHQKYYRPGSKIGILCSAESYPLPEYVRLQYRLLNHHWQHIEPNAMLQQNGTFESALHWDTVINQTMDVKCDARSVKNVHKFDLMRIKVAEGTPEVSHTVIKSKNATPLEDSKDIYEGDDVTLMCTYPKDNESTAKWKFNGNELPSSQTETTTTDVSTSLIANLKQISATGSGNYTCVLNNNNEEKQLAVTILVYKSLKPHHTDSDSEAPVELKYGYEARLSCYLEGQPKPQIYWYKDGRPYTQGLMEDHNRTLHIPRVAVEDRGKFTCRAVNRAGYAEATFHTTVSGEPKRVGTIWITVMTIVSIVLGCCFCGFAYMLYRQRKDNKEQIKALEILYEQLMRETNAPPPSTKEPLDQRVSDLPYNREFELEKEMLEIGNRLGAGQFGQVWKGTLKKSRVTDQSSEAETLDVAVKGPLNGKNPTHQKMLADELKIMCAIGKHPNVLALVGAITKNMKGGELFVVVEYCEHGNLKDFLSKRRSHFINELRPPETKEGDYMLPDSAKKSRYANEVDENWGEDAEKDRLLPESNSLTTSDLLSYGMQVAYGMEYLASIPCIHRDLAARNVLITSNFNCRIADFGMARNDNKNYYRRKSKNVPVPYRWMSIEAIEQGIFTVESDMWSFGVLLYEIFSLSGMPYPVISNEELLDKLKSGYRNPMPKYCHEDIYQLMMQCWLEDPTERPTFTHCVHLLKNHLELASPQLLARVDKEISKDVARQNNLSKWITQDIDYREQARNALARQEASRAPNGENIYLRSY